MGGRKSVRVKVVGSIVLFGLGAAVIFSKRANELPFDPMDGTKIYAAINRLALDANGSGFDGASGVNVSETVFDRMTDSEHELKYGPIPVCAGVVRFKTKHKPLLLSKLLSYFTKGPAWRIEFNALAVNSRAFSESFESTGFGFESTSGNDFSPAGRHAKKLFGELEPNSHLRMNDDFAFIQVGSDMRVYSLQAIPPRATILLKGLVKDTVGRFHGGEFTNGPDFGL